MPRAVGTRPLPTSAAALTLYLGACALQAALVADRSQFSSSPPMGDLQDAGRDRDGGADARRDRRAPSRSRPHRQVRSPAGPGSRTRKAWRNSSLGEEAMEIAAGDPAVRGDRRHRCRPSASVTKGRCAVWPLACGRYASHSRATASPLARWVAADLAQRLVAGHLGRQLRADRDRRRSRAGPSMPAGSARRRPSI